MNFIFYCYVFTINLNVRALQQLQNKMLKVKSYKEGLLNALGEFLGEHFPIPEKGGITKKKVRFS